MNVESPSCGRCAGVRFFHLQHMWDAERFGRDLEWLWRPVAAQTSPPSELVLSLGHFDTLLCRTCGLTTWYAIDWSALRGPRTPAHCRECASTTPHVELPAIEHSDRSFEQARITHGMVGREGYLFLSICERCSRTRWRGREYQHLDGRVFVSYQRRNDAGRPCLECEALDALIDPRAREYDRVDIPVAVLPERGVKRLLTPMQQIGHFELRLCRPCGSVEWYARDFAELAADPEHGITEIGEPPEMSSLGGPYR